MKKMVIITSKFNIMTGERNTLYGKNEAVRTTKAWIDHRVDIFMNFTAKSLIKQTNQNFYAIYAYEDSTEKILLDSLNRYPKLQSNIMFVKKTKYMETIDNISKDLDILYLTRLDSDDMYVNDFVQKIYDFDIDENTQAILCRDGYVYDSKNKILAEYSHSSFTFYTFIYRLYKEKVRYSSLNITPWDLLINFFHFSINSYTFKLLEGRNFIFNIHSQNTDSVFPQASFLWYTVGTKITDEETKSKILSNFFIE